MATGGRRFAGSQRRSQAGKKPRPVVKARVASACPGCGDTIKVGQVIDRYGEDWMHHACVVHSRNKARIMAGETYASRKPSHYRIGATPGSPRHRA